MKKIILTAALVVSAMSAQAVVTVEGSRFFDNWSVTLKGGAVSPLKGHGFWENARGIFGAELRKQITPSFGLGVEGEWTVNTSSWYGPKSANAIDHQFVGVFGTLNLMNAFAGYQGSPRLFEIEAVAGTGWLHSYYTGCNCDAQDGNAWGNKVGLNFNFNLGASKAWTISLKPALLWNMGAYNAVKPTDLGYSAQYNANAAYVEMEAGVTYHFKNSNGTHSFKIVEPMDWDLVNSLKAQNAELGTTVDAQQAEIARLMAALKNCENSPKTATTTIITEELVQDIFAENYYKRYIFFDVNSSTITPLQMPEVYLVADLLKKRPSYKVNITGYASPEGPLDYNQQLSQRRADSAADALKNYLRNEYDYSESDINKQVMSPEGKGIELIAPFDSDFATRLKANAGNQWNRVAVYDIDFE